MSNYTMLEKGFRTLCSLVLKSRLQNIKPIAKRYDLITGSGSVKYVNKTYDNGKKHNVLRMYVPTRNGLEPWFDMSYRFHTYVKEPNEQHVVSKDNLIITWINLENVYIELFIEHAPSFETSSNTSILIEDEDELYENLSDEAEYFYMRSTELAKSDNVPTNLLTAPPKPDSVAYVDKICAIMGGNY